MSEQIVMSKSDLKEIYESYNEYFNEILDNIIDILQKSVKLFTPPTYKRRVKSFNSYYKKVLR